MQSKAQWNTVTSVRIAIIQKTVSNDKDVAEKEPSYNIDKNENWYSHY